MREIFLICKDILIIIRWIIEYFRYQRFQNDFIFENKELPLFVMGNGPSLSKIAERLDEREKFNICTVNYSMSTDLFFKLKPEMHVFVDPVLFNTTDAKNKDLYEAFKKITWKLLLFVPYGLTKEMATILKSNSNITVCRIPKQHLNIESRTLSKLEYAVYKKGWAAPCAMNVVVGAIFCGINIGYRKIFLFGVDHSWMKYITVENNNDVCLEDQHYYGTEKRVWNRDESGASLTMYELYFNFTILYDSYNRLKRYADYLDVKVINKTPGSFIDAFPKEID